METSKPDKPEPKFLKSGPAQALEIEDPTQH